MATCNTCHRDAGWLKHECDGCRQRREAAEAAQIAASRAAAEQDRLSRINGMVDEALTQLRASLDAGGTVVLVDLLTLPLDDGRMDDDGLDQLRDLGARGWSIASSSPVMRTSRNMDGAIHSIDVDKLQVLVQLTVAPGSAQALEAEIRKHYAARAAAEVDAAR